MKAAPFSYARPSSIAEVCELLASADADVRIVAGGQTLIPLMAMRLARPSLLVDINWIPELKGIEAGEHQLAIRACTRQARAERDECVARDLPLLLKALRFVGHPPTRARGTIGGSIANADPAAEIGLVAAVLDARVKLTGLVGTQCVSRMVPAREFVEGPMQTAREDFELLEEACFPVWDAGAHVGAGFQEVAVRDGDFALVAAAAQVSMNAEGTCERIAFGVTNAAVTPVCADQATARSLIGTRLTGVDIQAAAHALDDRLNPPNDLHANAAYRRHLVPHLLARALTEARDEAHVEARDDAPEVAGA